MEVENTDLKIKDENGRVFVNKCSEKITRGAKHMLTSMRLGEKNRSIGETNMNERSSRSHTIFRIVSTYHAFPKLNFQPANHAYFLLLCAIRVYSESLFLIAQ